MEPLDREGLIVRYLLGEASPDEVAEVNLLEETDTGFRKELREMNFAWEQSAFTNINTGSDWVKIRHRIGFQSSKVSPYAIFARVAAVIVLVLSVSTALWLYWNVPGYGRWVVFETGLRSDSIVLPDESIVFLNRNSSLKFRNKFHGSERYVSFEGEGYFEIANKLDRPFKINVGHVSVKVLGTSFHVSQYKNDGIVEVNVTHGSVSLANNNEQITVLEGERVLASRKMMERGFITNPNFISWKTGLIEFRNSSLGEIAKVLNNHFVEIENIKIETESDILVTTRFQGQSLPSINEELAAHFQKKFTLHQGTLIISD